MNTTVSMAPKQQQANERITASRESGCDAYLRCMWDEAEESGSSVNWDNVDYVIGAVLRHVEVKSPGGYKDEPGYSECRERTLI